MERRSRYLVFGLAVALVLGSLLLVLAWGRSGPEKVRASGATMTLAVKGGDCTGTSPNVKCSVDPDVLFTVSIIGDATGTDIGGFQTEFFFTGLTYKDRATCEDEVNLLPISMCLPFQWPPAQEAGGQIIHGGLTGGFGSQPATKGATGETLVEVDLTCETDGVYKIALTAGGQANSTPLASQFNDTATVNVYPKSVGKQTLPDVGLVAIADTLLINCGDVPTETPTITPTPCETPGKVPFNGGCGTPTPTITPGGPTLTPTPTVTATGTATATATTTATATATGTVTSTATNTPTVTNTPTATATATSTATATASATGTATRTSTPTVTSTSTATPTITDTPTITPTPTPLSEKVIDELPAGGKVTTDTEGDGATGSDPIETSVILANGGQVSINEGLTTQPDAVGFSFLKQQVNIGAPSGTSQDPLIITFTIDVSLVPAGENEQTIQVFKGGLQVAECAGPAGKAQPDPCVAKRNLLVGTAAGDIEIVVLSSTASAWNFGVVVPEPPFPLGDVDCDGDIDSVDSAWLLLFEVGLVNFVPCLQNADVDENGIVNVFDALLILQFHAGLIDDLPPSAAGVGGGLWQRLGLW